MLFGKIDYLNLLPFYLYLKASNLTSYEKKSMEFNKNVPSFLCDKLYRRKIDGAIISSIESRYKKYKKLNLGVVSNKAVKSVLVRKNSKSKLDTASRSSNMLSTILNIKGEILIGDRALKAYILEGKDSFYDLGEEWNKKMNLPFVFGLFCCTKNAHLYERLINDFLSKKIKIPYYILKKYSKQRDIRMDDIKWYLQYISYEIGIKEQKAFKIFIKKARELNFNPASA